MNNFEVSAPCPTLLTPHDYAALHHAPCGLGCTRVGEGSLYGMDRYFYQVEF